MDSDTAIGGSQDRFPITRRSAVVATRSPDAVERGRAFEALVAAYWKPVYKYIRIKWGESNEDAKDLTQAFFARAIEKGFFQAYDPGKATFRTYLRACLDRFLSNENKAAHRIKRGGDTPIVPLDFEGADGELVRQQVPRGESMEEYFHKEWVRSLFSLAVERLREECEAQGKTIPFRLFERYDLEETSLTYEQLGAEFGLATTNVTNYLAFARREFRRIVLESIREVSVSEEEFRTEARLVLGIDPR